MTSSNSVVGLAEIFEAQGKQTSLRSSNMYDNLVFDIYQDLQTEPDRAYACSFSWKFSKFYAAHDPGDNKTYIPYLYIFLNYGRDVVHWVSPSFQNAGTWHDDRFIFVSQAGHDRLWFSAASPQTLHGPEGGENYLELANVVCVLDNPRHG